MIFPQYWQWRNPLVPLNGYDMGILYLQGNLLNFFHSRLNLIQ